MQRRLDSDADLPRRPPAVSDPGTSQPRGPAPAKDRDTKRSGKPAGPTAGEQTTAAAPRGNPAAGPEDIVLAGAAAERKGVRRITPQWRSKLLGLQVRWFGESTACES